MKKIAVSLACLIVASTSACSFNASFTTAKVNAADIQQKVSTEIKAQTGHDAVVSCPGDLPGKKDATLTCTAAVNGATYPVRVVVTEAEGNNIRYTWKLENDKPAQPSTAPKASPTAEPTSTNEASPSSDPTDAATPSADKAINKTELEYEVEDRVKPLENDSSLGVNCPDPLTAEVGAKTTCKVFVDMTAEEHTYEVEVTGVDGQNAKLNIKRVG